MITRHIKKHSSIRAVSGARFHLSALSKALTIQRLILFFFVSSLLLPLFSATLTYAARVPTGAATATTYSPQQAATALSYYNVLLQCVGGNMKGTIQLNAADNGNATPASWFDNNNAQGTVFPDGKKDCKDIAPDALTLWGFSSNQDFLTALGYGYNPSNFTWNGPGGLGYSNQRAAQFQTAVGLKVYGQIYSGQYTDPPISDAARYTMYLHAFTSSDCKASDLGLYPTNNNTFNDLAKSNGTEDASSSATITGASGTITYTLVSIVKGTQKEVHAFAYNSAQTSAANPDTGQTSSTETSSLLYGYNQNPGRGANVQSCKDLASGLTATAPAALAWNIAHPDQQIAAPVTAQGNNADGTKSTCNVEGVGWIICPVMRLMANVVDAAYGFVASLLVVQPLMTTGHTANIYAAWSTMRSFANVAFVIAFIIIIYSQLTGAGINNYGIKKMLPKLIVAAILVNVSYWICAIAIDLSNIIGSSVNGLFQNAIPAAGAENTAKIGDAASGNGPAGWVGITGAVLIASGAILYIGLSALLPAIIAALFAIVTVFLVLTLRQALIILLVIVSPLAFVAYLLPNTESWFKKWRELFQTLLLMFPIIAFLFGASALASVIVMNGAPEKSNYRIAIQIMGALIAIIPLALTPLVMRTAGGVLGKFGGMINNPNRGPFDRMKKGAEGIRNRQQDRRAIRSMNGGDVFGGGQFRRRAKREAIDASLKRERSSLEQQHVAQEAMDNDGDATRFGRKLAGAGPLGGGADAGAIQRALSNASFTIDEAIAKDIKAESVTVRDLGAGALKDILKDKNSPDAKKAAAMQRLIKISDPAEYAEQVDAALADTAPGSSTLRRATAEALGSDGPGFLKASDIDMWASGSHVLKDADNNPIKDANGKTTTLTLKEIAQKNVNSDVISVEKLVGETAGNMQFAWDSADNDGKIKLTETAKKLRADPILSTKIKHNATAIKNMADAIAPNTPPAMPTTPPAAPPSTTP